MNYKFKIGDVVEVVESGWGFGVNLIGDRYTIKGLSVYPVGGDISSEAGYIVVDSGGKVKENFGMCVGEQSFKLVEEEKGMNVKALLKDGMRVVLRSEGNFIVVNEVAHLVKDKGWMGVGDYSDDLTYSEPDSSEWDVVAIYEAPHVYYYLNPNELGKLVWQRENEEDKAKRIRDEEIKAEIAKLEQAVVNLKQKLIS